MINNNHLTAGCSKSLFQNINKPFCANPASMNQNVGVAELNAPCRERLRGCPPKFRIVFSTLFILASFYSVETYSKDCKRMVYVYDIAVCVPNAPAQLYQASDGCVEQLLLNSRGSNEFFSLDFQPVRILQEATKQVLIGPSQGPYSNIDYMIWGELKDTGTGRYAITLYLVTANTRQTVAKGSSTFTDPGEAKFSGMTAALNLGGGNTGSRKLIDVITDFEKKTRKEDDRKAICPEVEYLMKEKSIDTEANKEVLLMFQVKDADGKPVRDADVYIRNEEGKLDKEECKSDQYGMVKVTHKTPDKNTEYSIRCFAKATLPSEKIFTTDNVYIPVKCKKKITKLVGEIEINETSKTGNPSLGNTKNGKSSSTSFAVSSLNMTIIPERIKVINESKEVFSRALNETSKFEIVTGSTMKNANGEPTIVRSESEYQEYLPCDEKLELSRSGKTKGSSNGCDINIAIALERGIESGDMTITNLSPRYCLVITGSNARGLFQTSKYRTTGVSSGQRRDYPCGKLTSFSEELDPKYGLSHGQFNYTSKINNQENHEIVIPMSIPNSKALEEYLLNPKGSYTISVSGRYIKKDYDEKQTDIHATLIMMPEE